MLRAIILPAVQIGWPDAGRLLYRAPLALWYGVLKIQFLDTLSIPYGSSSDSSIYR